MTSSPAGAIGPQRPQVRNAPPRAGTVGPDAARLADAAGLGLDPWQRLALDDILAYGPDGRFAARRAAVKVNRQNGKGGINEAYVLDGLFLAGVKLISYSAHEYDSAQEMFIRIRTLIENTPALSQRVKPNGIRVANGEQGITLKSGARLRFMARTGGSGRGFTGDRIVLDEAQALQSKHMAALVPILAARPDAQVLMTGTAPYPSAEVFPRIIEAGRSADPGLCYLEWGLGPDLETGPLDLDDPALWREANPAYGIRLFDDAIRNERALLDDESFARERLGVIGNPNGAGVIDMSTWERLHDAASKALDPVAFAADVTPDRAWSSVCSAGLRADGCWHVELADNRRGTGWVAERLAELVERWKPSAVLLDPAGPAGGLLADLSARDVDVTAVSAREMAQAAGAFADAVSGQRLRHLGQPALNAAVDAGRRRSLGDAWAWARKDSSADISPLVAATLALHGHRNVKPPQSRQILVFR